MSQPVLISWLLFAAHVLIVLVAAVLISANRKPSAAIAWLLALIFVPLLGICAFLLVGFGRLPRKRRAKQREVCDAILARTPGLDRVSHRDEWPSWLASMVAMNRNLGSLPMVGGNSAELIESYLGSFQAMADAIDRAEHFVHVEFFILVQDEATAPVFDALERACKRGVQVRVLSDHVAQFMYPHRKATIVLAHGGEGPPGRLDRLLMRNPNLRVDLSGMHFQRTPALATETGPLDPGWKALIEKMPDRFLMGVDVWAARLFEPAMLDRLFVWTRRILGELRPDVAERVAHQNAMALYRLE